MKKIVLCLTIFIFNLNVLSLFSQGLEPVKNSLKKFTFEEIERKIFTEKDSAAKIVYASEYLLKAQKEKILKQTINGYWLLSENSNFKEALKYNDSMINLSKASDPKFLAKSYYRRGQIFHRKRKMKEALESYLLAYKYVHKNSKDLKYYILYSIGVVKNIQENYKEALPLFIECEKYYSCGNASDYLLSLFALAETYNKLNDISKSEFYTNKGLQLSKKNNNVINTSYFVSNQGKNNFKKKKYSLAIDNLKSTLSVLKNDAKDFSNYAENCYYIGASFLKLHKKDVAVIYFKKVDSIFAKENDIYPEALKSYFHLIDYYKEENNYKKALFYTNALIKADSVATSNNEYLTFKVNKEYDIPQLKSSREEIILKLKDEKLKSLSLLILSSIIALTFITYFIIAKRKREKEIKKQKMLFDGFIEKKKGNKLETETVELKFEKEIIGQSDSISNIDPKIVDAIMINLLKFENEFKFLKKDCTIDYLAIEFKTNSNYLSKIINEKKGLSFPTYINNLRIDYIIQKLENDSKFRNYKIKVVSDYAGYNNVQSFSRAFVSRTNVNPSFFIRELINRNLA